MKANKMRNSIILFVMLLLTGGLIGHSNGQNKSLNPTGSYYRGDKRSGEVRVKLLDNNKIAITLLACVGKPSYNSGGFVDTLDYQNRKAIYKDLEDDSSCVITLKFSEVGIDIEQQQANLNWACGFGHGVDASGYYKKVSSKVPKIRNLQWDE
jgi:hypothetical protein